MNEANERRWCWGDAPWEIDFKPEAAQPPSEADIAVIGGGFTGLAAAAWFGRMAPEKTVVVLEADRLGSGASGRTGGIALAGTAAGDLPGLGDVLKGFERILAQLEVECDFRLGGVWEISHRRHRTDSPINWEDSGQLRVAREVAGGTVDPGKLVSGLARAARRAGAVIAEVQPVRRIHFEHPLRLELPQGELLARQVLLATNALSLDLAGLAGKAEAMFTLAAATASLDEGRLEALGLGARKPFYTIDLPYLWGRVRANNGIVFGGGLVEFDDSGTVGSIEVSSGRSAELIGRLERRVRGLHPALRSVEFTHRWGGPILFPSHGVPFFDHHPSSQNTLVVGGYSGHGVSLSVYLGCWAAEVLVGQRALPKWGDVRG